MAGFRSKVVHNIPKVELHSIWSLVVGGYKTGKTRLWKEVVEKHYKNPEEALLIGFEKGYETWELENIIPIHEEGEDWQVWEYFRNEVVKGLVKEAKEGKIVKLIGIDTADRAVDACTAWVLKEAEKKYVRNFDSLQEISNNTDENGWTLLYEELKKQFDALVNAKYGIMALAWTKEKETTLYNGLKFNSLELMMHNTARKIFESQASLICCLHNEILVTDKSGTVLDENAKDKKGKEKASNFHETKSVMRFRPSEYVSIAGGRYTNLPDKVDYSADNFLQVFEDAVNGQLKKTTQSVDELRVVQEQENEQQGKAYAEKAEQKPIEPEKTPKQLIAEINAAIKVMSNENKKLLQQDFTVLLGDPASYPKLTDTSLLQKCLEAVGKYK